MEFLTELNHWTWWVAGVVLLVVEMLVPGAFFMWMGISALVTGGALWLFPELSWTAQLSLFSVLSISSIVIWRKLFPNAMSKTDQPLLNKRAQQYVGRTFTLEHAIVNGVGEVHVDDSTWRINSDEDLPAGTRIKVIGVDNMSLTVEKA